ncbi:MBL fold metallo-hydrolase [Nocardioides aequoreus]|uniref:MBL fold metallo-hydrolase n=1 Tax=Nocardioides aequoreus TaxID=397278 RepID=UPI00068F015C|nr:MBL fold metallo-hydrolase [Nocardioides aequoreus]
MPETTADTTTIEVADRVWVVRHAWYDVNVTAVAGDRGLLLVDTHASSEAFGEVLHAVRRVTRAPLVEVVNTHVHVDHVLGNAAAREAGDGVVVTAHEGAAEGFVAHLEGRQRHAVEHGHDRAAEMAASTPSPPDRTFSSVAVVDLGDRAVELVHPGRGHTAGDLVCRLREPGGADVLLAGDLVEESGHPAWGDDSFPMEWPLTLDLVTGLATPDTVVVPGHGAPVDLDFVTEQRAAIGVVAETIRDLASRGVPVAEALDAGDWPYPAEVLAHAVRRGYEHLPRSQKRLPLL